MAIRGMYKLTVAPIAGGKAEQVGGHYGNVASARQAMIDHAGLVDVPNVPGDYYGPIACMNIVEGFFVGKNEYCIEVDLGAVS